MVLRKKLSIEKLSENYHVRRIKESDIQAVYELCISNPLYYQHMKMEPTIQNLREVMTALPPATSMDDKYFVGYFEGGRLVAILDLVLSYPKDDIAFIGWFMMIKGYQGKHIGSSLITELTHVVSEAGYAYMQLGYIKGNAQSEAFWKRNGFTPTGIETDTEDYTVVVMRKACVRYK